MKEQSRSALPLMASSLLDQQARLEVLASTMRDFQGKAPQREVAALFAIVAQAFTRESAATAEVLVVVEAVIRLEGM